MLFCNCVYVYIDTYIHTYKHSGDVQLTYGKQAFDSSATPVSQDQIPAAPILMFKAPPGAVFLADVEISIPVDKSVLAMLFGSDSESDSDSESESGGRRNHDEGDRRVLNGTASVQVLKQHWFNTGTKVCRVSSML